MGNSPKAKKNEDADFDMFAQSRTATYESTKTRQVLLGDIVVSVHLHFIVFIATAVAVDQWFSAPIVSTFNLW